MTWNQIAETLGIVGATAMPLFNIPLIFKLVKRKKSSDYSLTWLYGVWISIICMTPQALMSHDMTLKVFGVLNFIFFNIVACLILKYHKNV